MNKYRSTVEQPVQAVPVEQSNPAEKAYLHTYQAAVGVPLVKACVYGLLFGLIAFITAWRLKADEPWLWGMFAALVFTVLRYAGDDLFWFFLAKAETITGIELDGKPGIGDQKITAIDLTTKVGATRRTQRLQIPCSPEQMTTLGLGILGGMPFSENRWTGKGKPFSLDEFRELREYLKAAELLELANEKSPNQGYQFSEKGMDMLKHYVPYPTDYHGQ